MLYSFDGITVDANRLEVRRGEIALELEPKALRVLLYLIANRDRVVTREELIQQVWAGVFVGDNSLTRVIAQIRKQLGDSAREPKYIETLATTGYRFIAPVGRISGLPRHVPGLPLLVAAPLALVAVAAWWLLRAPAEAPPRLTALRQVTSSAGADLWPSFSPDASEIVYSSNSTGDFQIYVRSLAPGGVERPLSSGPGAKTQPAWSPDGKYIAYVSRSRGGIAVVPVSGGVPRYLTDTGDSPRWSPDSRALVYRTLSYVDPAIETTGMPDTTLALVDVASGLSRQLTRPGDPPGGHTQPSWLPDNRHVVFSVASGAFAADKRGKLLSPGAADSDFATNSRAFSTRPWIIDTQTGKFEPVQTERSAVRSPLISADSRYLYFIGAGGIEPGVWRARLQQGWRAMRPEAVLPASGAAPRDLAISADGTRMAVSQQFGANSIWSVPLDATGAPAGEPHPILRDRNLRHSEVQFSADGSRIVYSSIRLGGDVTVFVANADGSSPAPLTPGDQDSGRPSWFGDELTVAYTALRQGKRQFWLAPIGGPARPMDLKLDLSLADRMRVSPDGKSIAAHITTPAGTQVVVEDLATGVVRRITPPERNIGFPVWSRDCKWIVAGERIKGNVYMVLIPTGGGPLRTLETGLVLSFAHDWAPDGDRISFSGQRDGVANIYWLSVSTGRVQQLTKFDSKSAFVRYPAWSPKGGQIVFEHNDLVANIYAGELR